MTREELFDAFREAVSSEFSEIPKEEEIPYEPSESFRSRRNRLLRSERQWTWRLRNTVRGKAVAVAAALLAAAAIGMLLFQTAGHFFFHNAQTIHIESDATSSPTGESGSLKERLRITSLPKGFREADVYSTPTKVTTTYTDDFGKSICLVQAFVLDDADVTESTPEGDSFEVDTPMGRIYMQISENQSYARWMQGESLISIRAEGAYSKEDLLSLIRSVR